MNADHILVSCYPAKTGLLRIEWLNPKANL